MSVADRSAELAVVALDVEIRSKTSSYPEPFFSRMQGRSKRVLGDLFGLKNFGVNLTTLAPGAESSILHRHSKQDEFVYILDGEPTLVTDQAELQMHPGMCAGFRAGSIAHQLVNRTDADVTFLEVGDRTEGDEGTYPKDDLKAVMGEDGKWRFTRKDGSAFGKP